MTAYWTLSTLAASVVVYFVALNAIPDRYGLFAFAAVALTWAIGVTAQLGV